MLITRIVAGAIPAGLIMLAADVASGQDYPNKPIRIVTTTAGGGNDFAARLIAQGLTVNLGQQVIVDNRSSTVVPGDLVAKAPPDGYTLLVAGGTFSIGPLLQKAPYDPVKDFAALTLAARAPLVVVVHPSSTAKSIKELIALAKANPGGLNYGTPGIGSSAHLSAELFKAMAGVNIVHIPYKGAGPATNDLLGGQVQLAFGNATSVTPHVKSGRLRALAVTTAEPSMLYPALPTVAASLPGYESASLVGIFVPAKTPAALVNRLNREIVRILNQADVKEKFFNSGVEVVGSSPAEFAATIKSEIARMGKVIKDVGIRAE